MVRHRDLAAKVAKSRAFRFCETRNSNRGIFALLGYYAAYVGSQSYFVTSFLPHLQGSRSPGLPYSGT